MSVLIRKVLRTPEECFKSLPASFKGFSPRYVTIDVQRGGALGEGQKLRMHYIDEGPRDGQVVLLLHGEPTWSFLYRKMIPRLTKNNLRAVAPDLIGFGRSDKPAERSDYSYARHVDWIANFVDALQLSRITLVCQDWGGLIGLRFAAENPALFERIVAANTDLPTGDEPPSEGFRRWLEYSQNVPNFQSGKIVLKGTGKENMSPEEIAAYDAPFPDESYKAGARAFPTLVPISPQNPASEANRRAWQSLSRWEKPFLTAFGELDKVFTGVDKKFQKLIPGAKAISKEHVTFPSAGHFLQEDVGEELADLVASFIQRHPTTSSSAKL